MAMTNTNTGGAPATSNPSFSAGAVEGNATPTGETVVPGTAPNSTSAPVIETPPTNPGGTGGAQGLTPEMIAAIEKARREERDKLYPDLERARAEAREMREREAERERQAQEAQARAAEEERRRQEAEMDARQLIETRTAEFESKFSNLTQQNQNLMALFENERRLNEANTYRAQALEAASDDI